MARPRRRQSETVVGSTTSTTPSPPRGARPRKPARANSVLVSLRQGSEETGIPVNTIRKHVYAGALPVVKLGVAWYFRRQDLQTFVDRQIQYLGAPSALRVIGRSRAG